MARSAAASRQGSMDTSYLSQQVTTIIERLHSFFDEIGVPNHERDSRESELFSALSETLHNQLNLVAKEKHDLTEEAQRLIKLIRQMERSLDDSKNDDDYDANENGLTVTYPLHECIQHLKEKHHGISKLHRERYEQVKKLVDALDSYASHLESSFVSIKLPPTSPNAKIAPNFDLSPTYVTKLDDEFTRVYEEYHKRLETVGQVSDEIIGLWSELGTPQAQIDSNIVRCARESPEQLGLHQEDLKRLTTKRDKLISEKAQRERKVKEFRQSIESLWDRLGVEENERKQFLSANRGCGLRTINEYEDELSRLNELKRQNLHLFVEDARFKLQELWDALYFSEEEMLDFTPAFSDVCSDALLSAHEQEISRLEALMDQRAPILAAVERHRSLVKERDDLEKSSQDASRLMGKGSKGEKRDPGKLLREEKMRKRITKELPKVEADLRKTLDSWEDEYGRPFTVHGDRYLDELESSRARAPPPPRSKTPNALPPKEAPRSGARSQAQSRGSVRGPPPPRSKTPGANPPSRNALSASTLGNSTIGNSSMMGGASMIGSSSMLGSSVSAHSATKTSPSKLPAPGGRVPMGSLRDGQNSPERRSVHAAHSASALGHRDEDLNRTVRGTGTMGPPPARQPPPKMKDLFLPPGEQENTPDPDRGSGGSVVRHVAPEDPYADRPPRPHSTLMGPPPNRPGCHRATASQDNYAMSQSRPLSRTDYPRAPPSRQTSNTSSVMSGGTASSSGVGGGSENWETYTDTSEGEEGDAAEAYYARMKAQQMQQYGCKRPGTAAGGGLLGGVKRVRGVPEEVEGSDGGWADEGETY